MNPISSNIKLIVIGVILLIVMIAAILLYHAGKKRGQGQGTVNISNPGSDTGEKLGSDEINVLVEKLYNDMSGTNVTHDTPAWEQFLALSNTDFINVYNEFNHKYQIDSKESMKSWVADESSWYNLTWDALQKSVLLRMDKLNLL